MNLDDRCYLYFPRFVMTDLGDIIQIDTELTYREFLQGMLHTLARGENTAIIKVIEEDEKE